MELAEGSRGGGYVYRQNTDGSGTRKEHGWCITSKQYRPVTDFDGSGGLAPLPTRNSIVICKISPAKIALFHPNQTLHSIAFTLPYASLGSASILSLVPCLVALFITIPFEAVFFSYSRHKIPLFISLQSVFFPLFDLRGSSSSLSDLFSSTDPFLPSPTFNPTKGPASLTVNLVD